MSAVNVLCTLITMYFLVKTYKHISVTVGAVRSLGTRVQTPSGHIQLIKFVCKLLLLPFLYGWLPVVYMFIRLGSVHMSPDLDVLFSLIIMPSVSLSNSAIYLMRCVHEKLAAKMAAICNQA